MNKVAKFEKVSFEQFKKDWKNTFYNHQKVSYLHPTIKESFNEIYENIKLPKRATSGSAGHDISIPFTVNVAPKETLKIPTGIRCEMDERYVMFIFPRSSLGIKKGLRILNTVPVIDGDYYHADNEGHIFICIKNDSNEVMKLIAGDNIVQAVFLPYGVADEEEIDTKRTGGIGSTTKDNGGNVWWVKLKRTYFLGGGKSLS